MFEAKTNGMSLRNYDLILGKMIEYCIISIYIENKMILKRFIINFRTLQKS